MDTAKQRLNQLGQIYILSSIFRMRNTAHKSQPAERSEQYTASDVRDKKAEYYDLFWLHSRI